MADRFRKSGRERLIVLVLGDFDPEGVDIGQSFARSMRDDFKIRNIAPIHVALTQNQVVDMALPPILKAKETSSRHDTFTEKYGDNVYELEAVPPKRLQQILRSAIDSVMDVDAFNAEIDKEKQDAAKFEGIRRVLGTTIQGMVREF
jgi:hypothetical protein